MSHHLSIDIETFSSVDLMKAGLYKYVESPDFQILLFAFSLDGQPVQLVDFTAGELLPPIVVYALQDPDVIKHAYNASFEWMAINKFYKAPLEQWHCTMLHGLYCGYPLGLAAVAGAMGNSPDKSKLATGKALIRTFCSPCKPTRANGYRSRTLPHHEPAKWELFKEYCKQDVVAEMEVENRLCAFPVLEQEQHLWEIDQRINAYGVEVDLGLIEGAMYCSDCTTEELTREAQGLTGLANPNSTAQLLPWLAGTGNPLPDMQKETVKEAIKGCESAEAKRMLEIRQELSKTSVTKYTAMDTAVCADRRVRGLLQFYGANRTGRWAGRLVQVQNLPRNYLATLGFARRLTKDRNLDALKMVYGNVPDTLSQLIRTAFVPTQGHIFVVSDFSAIEARVIAWLADEQWRQEVFATHGKIYEASAAAMFGVPIEKITKGNPEYALRQKGKVAELALGYQGAAGALIAMGALNMGLTEEELPDIVSSWRRANRRIVDLWHSMENAALEVMHTGQAVGLKGLILALDGDFTNGQEFLTIRLPSGRRLYYVKPFITQNQWGRDSIGYYGMDQTTKKWGIVETYGGKLVENVVQAIARDCLAESLVRLEGAGYQTVMHIHDEVIIDHPICSADRRTDQQVLKDVTDLMSQPIGWAEGLILTADGFTTDFYKKE